MARPVVLPRPRWRPRLLAGLAAVAAAVALYFAVRPSVPLPPVPDPPTAGADPELVSVVGAARKAVAADPHSDDAWGKYGTVLQAHDFRPEADTCYRAAHALNPADGRWPYLIAAGLAETDPAAAADWFGKAVAANLPDPAARAAAEDARAEAQLAAGERPAPALPPTTPRRQLIAARSAAAAGEDARAADLLADLTNHPNAARQALALLAQVQRRLGRPEVADQAGRAAARITPDAPWPDPVGDPIPALNRTRVSRHDEAARLLRQGQPAEAERLLRPLAAGNTDPEALFGWAQALADLNDKPAARRALVNLLRLEPGHVNGNMQYALLLVEEGERLWTAGDRAAATAEFRSADAALDRVLAANPATGKALMLKGITLQRFLGRPADGVALLEQFVRLRPAVAEGHFRLGEALAAAGRPADARAALLRAAALAGPGDTRAAAALANLKGG